MATANGLAGYLGPGGSVARARGAPPEHGKMARVDGEAESAPRTFRERAEELLWRFHRRTAALADEMTVRCRGEVISGRPVTQMRVNDHADALELVEVPVDGRHVHVGCPGLHRCGQILRGAVSRRVEERVEQLAPGRRDAPAAGAHQGEDLLHQL